MDFVSSNTPQIITNQKEKFKLLPTNTHQTFILGCFLEPHLNINLRGHQYNVSGAVFESVSLMGPEDTIDFSLTRVCGSEGGPVISTSGAAGAYLYGLVPSR